VFPDEFGRNQEKALESALTAGGIAEVLEDNIEEGGTVTLLRAWRARRNRAASQLGDSSDPRVSKTS
jgi:phosphosulfolactate phosphohydrolase-like enzyme